MGNSGFAHAAADSTDETSSNWELERLIQERVAFAESAMAGGQE
jgi:hypothetical protein